MIKCEYCASGNKKPFGLSSCHAPSLRGKVPREKRTMLRAYPKQFNLKYLVIERETALAWINACNRGVIGRWVISSSGHKCGIKAIE